MTTKNPRPKKLSQRDRDLQRLIKAGYSPSVLAHTLDVPIERIMRLPGAAGIRATVEDDELRSGVRALGWKAIERANQYMDPRHGSVQQQLAIAMRLVAPMMKTLVGDDPKDIEEMRDNFTSLMKEVRVGWEAGRSRARADDPDERRIPREDAPELGAD